jgi:hypothetical protein
MNEKNDETISTKYASYIITSRKSEVYSDFNQSIYKFPNGYGASVVYGNPIANGLELAVLDKHSKLCYTTPITDDVICWLNEAELNKVLSDIMALPKQGE